MDDDAIDTGKLDLSGMTLGEIMADQSPEMRAEMERVVEQIRSRPLEEVEWMDWPTHRSP